MEAAVDLLMFGYGGLFCDLHSESNCVTLRGGMFEYPGDFVSAFPRPLKSRGTSPTLKFQMIKRYLLHYFGPLVVFRESMLPSVKVSIDCLIFTSSGQESCLVGFVVSKIRVGRIKVHRKEDRAVAEYKITDCKVSPDTASCRLQEVTSGRLRRRVPGDSTLDFDHSCIGGRECRASGVVDI